MNASDGSSQKRLTRKSAIDTFPVWSPDGKKIAFTRSGNGSFEVYVMKARPEGERNRPRNLTQNPAIDYLPDWQPLIP